MSTVHVLLMQLGVNYNIAESPSANYQFYTRIKDASGYGDPPYILVMATIGAVGFNLPDSLGLAFSTLLREYLSDGVPLPDEVQFASTYSVITVPYSYFSDAVIPRMVSILRPPVVLAP